MSKNSIDAYALITAYVEKLRANNPEGKSDYVIQRYDRIKAYGNASFENQQKLDKAFRAIGKYAQSDDKAISLFLCLPDKPMLEFATGIYRKRGKLPDAERDDYQAIAKTAKQLRKLTSKTKIHHMIMDLPPSDDLASSLAHDDLTRDLYSLPKLLSRLIKVAEAADPASKYLTTKLKSDDAAKQTYIALLARLNDIRYLKKPCHAAIATLANANSPDVTVATRAITNAYAKAPHDATGNGLMKTDTLKTSAKLVAKT